MHCFRLLFTFVALCATVFCHEGSGLIHQGETGSGGSVEGGRIKAALVSVLDRGAGEMYPSAVTAVKRRQDLYQLMETMRNHEDQFNRKYNYDWVIFSYEPLNETRRSMIDSVASGNVHFAVIPEEQATAPEWIDQQKATDARNEMKKKHVIYGDSVNFRDQSRFEAGFMWRHPIMDQYTYYWRVDHRDKLLCDVNYDVFKFMQDNHKQYGFMMSLYEYFETIPTLWQSTKHFINENPQYLAQDSLADFLSDDGGQTYSKVSTYGPHIAALDFWRSEAYTKYFDHLDHVGGFYYERWDRKPIQTIATSLFLNKDRVHFFDDIGVYSLPFQQCPRDQDFRRKNRCICNPEDDFTWKGYSTVSDYYKAKGIEDQILDGVVY